MEMPNVITEIKDPKKNFIFRVRAYRKLTPQEMRMSFAQWNQQRDKRKSINNKVIEVVSIIGGND
jgi:hypothetical protein